MHLEENEILYCLSQFKTLKIEQVQKLLRIDAATVNKVIQYLLRHKLVFQSGPYLSIIPTAEPDENVILAFWVLTEFADQLTMESFYAAEYPAQIFFLKGGTEYEIITVRRSEEFKFSIIENRCKNGDSMHYIFVTDSRQMLNEFPELNLPADYAVADNHGVRFFARSKNGGY